MRRKLIVLSLSSLSIAIAVACGSSDGSHFVDGSGDSGLDGRSTSGDPPIFGGDGGTSGSSGSSGDPDASLGTCDAGCVQGAHCKYEVCVPDLGSCTSNDTCPGDSYCDPSDKTCVPYGVPSGKINDPTCKRDSLPGIVTPEVQCEWTGTPDAGDPTFQYNNSYNTPLVADLNLDLDPNKLQPSIVMTTWGQINGTDFDAGQTNNERIGMLRVFDGRTCTEQMRIGGPDDPEVDLNRTAYGTQIAVGDLDGDVGTANGHPEIVALHRQPGAFNGDLKVTPLSVIAYAIDSSAGADKAKLVRKWIGKNCTDGSVVTFGSNSDNYGPGIWDLDNDGKPEVILDKNVFNGADGCLITPPAGASAGGITPGQYQAYLDHGQISTIADVDLDGAPDLVRYDGIYGWDTTKKDWVLKSYFKQDPAQKVGHVAVVDIGPYSAIPGHPKTDKLPEVVVVSAETTAFNSKSNGSIRVQDLTGTIVFGPVTLYKTVVDGTGNDTASFGGHGGPPTASDFDGDGYPEFAAAANAYYTVYDPDCVGIKADGTGTSPNAAARPGGKCDRPAYMKTQTAGPVPLESGILWAQASQDFSSSETGSSIFDFNGDGKSEAVYRDECFVRVYEGATGNVIFSAPASSGTGQEYPVICDADGDFATEIVVTRAPKTGPDNCPKRDPLAPDSGAPDFSKKGGFEILRDPLDRWVASRPIWNQHAYSITNVNDNASIPKSSDVKRNWEVDGLNNFRQNTQGGLSSLALADLTATISNLAALCNNPSGEIPLNARVCNRGTNPVQDGVTVAFYATPKGRASFDAAGSTLICADVTKTLLNVGDCTAISCTGTVAGDVDVYVVTDPDGKVADCHPGNNNGASARVLCSGVK